MEANKHTNTAQKFHQFAPKNGMYCIHSMYTKQRERELSFTQFCFHQSQNNHHKVIILKKKLKKKTQQKTTHSATMYNCIHAPDSNLD